MKKILFVLTMLAALLISSVAMAASSLIDNADLLSPRQEREVLQFLEQVERSHNVRAGALDLRRGPQGPALVASGKASPHASSSGAFGNSSPADAGA